MIVVALAFSLIHGIQELQTQAINAEVGRVSDFVYRKQVDQDFRKLNVKGYLSLQSRLTMAEALMDDLLRSELGKPISFKTLSNGGKQAVLQLLSRDPRNASLRLSLTQGGDLELKGSIATSINLKNGSTRTDSTIYSENLSSPGSAIGAVGNPGKQSTNGQPAIEHKDFPGLEVLVIGSTVYPSTSLEAFEQSLQVWNIHVQEEMAAYSRFREYQNTYAAKYLQMYSDSFGPLANTNECKLSDLPKPLADLLLRSISTSAVPVDVTCTIGNSLFLLKVKTQGVFGSIGFDLRLLLN